MAVIVGNFSKKNQELPVLIYANKIVFVTVYTAKQTGLILPGPQECASVHVALASYRPQIATEAGILRQISE